MSSRSAEKIKIASFDDLFGEPVEVGVEQIINVKLSDLHTFKNHPFKVKDDEKMQETVESIKEYGVLNPGLVRPRVEGGYEIIAGHRRKRGCELAGLEEMPVIVRDISDDEATIVMVDTNIQRESLDYSEKAFAFKMKYDAMKHRGSKGTKTTAQEIGDEVGESGRQIQRYIRLTELIPELLELIDVKKIGFIPAVDLSYLTKEEQEILSEIISENGVFPNINQAAQLKQYSATNELNRGMITLILTAETKKESKISLSTEKISSYFPQGTSKKDIEAKIYELLEKWNRGGTEQ